MDDPKIKMLKAKESKNKKLYELYDPIWNGKPKKCNCTLFTQHKLTSSGSQQKVFAQDGAREVIQMVPQKGFGYDAYIHYHDWCNDVTGMHMCQNLDFKHVHFTVMPSVPQYIH